MTNMSGANLHNGTAVGPQGEGSDSPSRFSTYPAYKDSGVEWLGSVPAHWVLTPIKHLALLNPRKSGFAGDVEQLCSFVPMEKLKTGVVQLDEERPIDEVIGGYTYFEDGDVLQAKVTPCFENKNVAIAKGLTNRIGFGSSEINVLRAYQGVNADYLYYRVQEDSYMSVCTSSMIGAGGLKRVPTDVINNFKIAAPTLCEQTQIARFLDQETARIDALIEEQQRLIDLLKEKRQAVISQAVTKGLDPTVPMKDSGVEWLGEVPAHWGITNIKRVGSIRYGIGEPPQYYPEGMPLIRATNVHAGKLFSEGLVFVDPAEIPARRIVWLEPGDIVVVRSGAYTGDSAIIPYDYGQCIAGFDMVLRCHSAQPEFVQFALLSKYLKEGQLDLEKMRAAQPHLNAEELGACILVLPPKEEQIKIVELLQIRCSEFDILTTEAERARSLLQERRSALISAAVTGKIDVRGWQPPASTPAPELAVAEAH
ncbi:restriction endonuclease subunit S [Pseudomonas sp. NY15364]|uniref:restriction endonuclease subunit S n=1 Tax=unclassified Pseudomonas TaxID=196821 RepID=UPI000F76CD75|nr:restriction endonuclease subunit S [Pseudomonas sp. o96-267]RRV42202.1 restriction endonuclease subunit S [Pseudomonas sp. o96-267]